jgi:hypothetical protein
MPSTMTELLRAGRSTRRGRSFHPTIRTGSLGPSDLGAELAKAEEALAAAKENGDAASVTYYSGVIDRLLQEARARAQRDSAAQPRHPGNGRFISMDGGARPAPPEPASMSQLLRRASGRVA